MMVFWLIVIAWLAACALAIRWTLPRLDASDKELDHEEAIDEDRRWDAAAYPVGLPRLQTAAEWYAYERRMLGAPKVPPVPPILNQSEQWLQNARIAESADDFWDGAA